MDLNVISIFNCFLNRYEFMWSCNLSLKYENLSCLNNVYAYISMYIKTRSHILVVVTI